MFYQLSENSHQGFDGLKAAFYLDSAGVKSNTTSELQLRLRSTRIRSRSSGKERDAETGLDFFGARYYSGVQGRFLSPDEILVDQFPQNPQSWNLYTYGRNNPLKYVDPSGQAVNVCLDDENGQAQCTIMSDEDYATAIAGYNPGINAPAAGYSAGPGGGMAMGGAITCGGVGCGSATYIEWPIQDTSLDVVTAVQAAAAIPSMIRGGITLGQALVKGVTNLFSKEAAVVSRTTVQDILQGAIREGGSRSEIFSKSGGFSQATKDFESLGGNTTTAGQIKFKDLPNGEGRAVLRNFSKDGRPTLEIQPVGGGYKTTAIRYNP